MFITSNKASTIRHVNAKSDILSSFWNNMPGIIIPSKEPIDGAIFSNVINKGLFLWYLNFYAMNSN